MTYQYEKVQDQHQRYQYCRDNGHLDFNRKARKCENFFAGDQWDEHDLAALAAEGRPAMTFNKVLPAVASVVGEHLNAQADIGFKPVKEGSMDQATVLNKTFVHVGNSNDLDVIEAEVFSDGVITSRGFFDVRMNFDQNIFGEVEITHLNPRNVVLDPDSEEYDPPKWKDFFLSKWLSSTDIERLYGKSARKELENTPMPGGYIGYDFFDDIRPGTFGGERWRTEDDETPQRRRFRNLERQYRTSKLSEVFVDLVTGETRRIPPSMEREKIQYILGNFDYNVIKRRVDIVKWCVTVNHIVVHEKESPYPDFTIVPFFPFFRHGRTLGLVENMVGPQEGYNKSRSQELHIVNTTANSGWQGEEGQLTNMDEEELEERGAQTGLVLMRKPGSPPLEKIQPNVVPTGLDRISHVAAQDLMEISMSSDSMRGFDRADVAAKAIQQKQAQGSANFSWMLMNRDRTRKLLAKNVLGLVQRFYTEERVLQITGGVNQDQMEEVTLNEVTPEGEVLNDMSQGQYDVVVASVPGRETYAESQFQQAVQLRELGVALPDQVLIANSHLADKGELLEQMDPAQGEQTEEEAAIMELELQLKQLEAAKQQAEIERINSETAVNMINAQMEGGQQISPEDQLAAEKLKQDHEAKLAQLELDKYKTDREFELKERELQLKQREINANTATKVAQIRSAEKTAQLKAVPPAQPAADTAAKKESN